jgi:hypothetical protein
MNTQTNQTTAVNTTESTQKEIAMNTTTLNNAIETSLFGTEEEVTNK